jgi:hypothetical protein
MEKMTGRRSSFFEADIGVASRNYIKRFFT